VNFTVMQSATVNLTIESLDIGHSFEIEEYEIDEVIEANDTINIVFTADKVGTFTYLSENCTETGLMIVEDPYVVGLPKPADITILYDLSHNSNTTAIKTKYSGIINWTQDSEFDVSINEANFLVETTLSGVNILIILEPNENLTDSELTDVFTFLKEGGSLLIAGSIASATTNSYKITQPFGFQFSNATARYINSTDLSNPIGINTTLSSFTVSDLLDHPIINENQYVPLTDEIVTKIEYTGTLLEYNTTWTEQLTPEVIIDTGLLADSYVMAAGNETIYADVNNDAVVDENETIGVNNTFIVACETSLGSRVIGLGSSKILNDTMTGRFIENGYFFERAIQWMAGMYSIVESSNYQISSYQIKVGDSINASVSFKAQNDTTLSDINVTLRIWRNSIIEKVIYLTPVNDTYFEGTFNTESTRRGTIYIDAVAHKRGYGYNDTIDKYVVIDPDDPQPYPVSWFLVIMYVATIAVGIAALSIIFVRVIRPAKSTPEIEEGEVVEEAEEESDEVDLDEYETEESEEDT